MLMAVLLLDAVPHHRNQRFVLSNAYAGNSLYMARQYAARIQVCVEGFEVHHALEAIKRKMRELHRADGDTVGDFGD